ncbi:MAG: hypothetical protein AB7T06_47155 [Kofleriaceae bacterium]
MRGWHLLAMVVVTACYSPTARPGAPCTLALDNCPSGQRCELVAGESICVIPGGTIDAGDGAPDANDANDEDAAPIDAPSVDAPLIDAAMIDAGVTPWALVQHDGESNGNDVNFAASGAGNLIVVGIETGASTAVTTVTDNAGNTYLPATGSRAINAQEDFGVELWYATNVNAGATRIVATADTIYGVVMWEVRGPTTLGNVAKLDNQAATNTPDGAPITTTTVGEFVVSIVIVQLAVGAIKPGFTNDESIYMNGWAHLTSNTAPPGTYTAEWNAMTGVYCASSAAFRLP